MDTTSSSIDYDGGDSVRLYDVEVQFADDLTEPLIDGARIQSWAKAALTAEARPDSSLVIRVVAADEMQTLNRQYRGKDKTTNVLSFAVDDCYVPDGFLGDIVICAPVVIAEAGEQGKTVEAHVAHLTLHGVLHLLGYDHEEEQQAQVMEAKEIALLQELGFASPYE